MKIKSDMESYVNVDRSKRHTKMLKLMAKIRAAQSLGSQMIKKKKNIEAADLYRCLITMLRDKKYKCVIGEHDSLFDEALKHAAVAKEDEQKAVHLRSALDTFYDEVMDGFVPVQSQMPNDFSTTVKTTLSKVVELQKSEDWTAVLSAGMKCLSEFTEVKNFRSLISIELRISIEFKLSNKKPPEAATKEDSDMMLLFLENLYSEIRLPESHQSLKPSEAVYGSKIQGVSEMTEIFNFESTTCSPCMYNIQTMSDEIMYGKSESHIQICNKMLSFKGHLTRQNRGGFACFRIIPENKEKFSSLIAKAKKIIIRVKSLETQNLRYKFQLPSEKALKSFNWQCDFLLHGTHLQTIVLDLENFWPFIFGHVLSGPGRIDISEVDCFGIIISHVTADGKENKEFREGNFGIGLTSISVSY